MKQLQYNLPIALLLAWLSISAFPQQTNSILTYNVETSGNISKGTYAPLWFTANRYGLSSNETNSGYLRSQIEYKKTCNINGKYK